MVMRLSQEFHGSCEAEPAPKAPSIGQEQRRATVIQVVVFISIVTDGVWRHRELSTKLDILALLSAPLLLTGRRHAPESCTRQGRHRWATHRVRAVR